MSVLGTGGGGMLGALLGQVSNTLSAPRRALWGALGGPESGSELLGRMGADPESALVKYLGGPAIEAALDPLTYAGLAIGSPALRAAIAPWRREKQLMQTIDQLSPLASRAQGAIDTEQAFLNATLKPRINPMAQSVDQALDLPGMVAGDMMTNADRARAAAGLPPRAGAGKPWTTVPAVADEVQAAGLGEMVGNDLAIYGNRLPAGVGLDKIRVNNRMAGTGPVIQQGGIPPEAMLAPGEMQYMRGAQAAGLAQPIPSQFSAFGVPPGPAGVPIAEDLVIERMRQAIARRRQSGATFGDVVSSPVTQPSQFSAFGIPPTQLAPPMQVPSNTIPGLDMMGLREGLGAVNSELGASRQALNQYQITNTDWAKIAAALGFGVAGGSFAGANGY